MKSPLKRYNQPGKKNCKGLLEKSSVPVGFLSLALIFALVAASISHFFTAAIKVSCFSSSEIGLKQSKNFE